jgi:hypothetical protein
LHPEQDRPEQPLQDVPDPEPVAGIDPWPVLNRKPVIACLVCLLPQNSQLGTSPSSFARIEAKISKLFPQSRQTNSYVGMIQPPSVPIRRAVCVRIPRFAKPYRVDTKDASKKI